MAGKLHYSALAATRIQSYMWYHRLFSGNSLPPVIGDVNIRVAHLEDSIISLNVDLLVDAIREEAYKHIEVVQ